MGKESNHDAHVKSRRHFSFFVDTEKMASIFRLQSIFWHEMTLEKYNFIPSATFYETIIISTTPTYTDLHPLGGGASSHSPSGEGLGRVALEMSE